MSKFTFIYMNNIYKITIKNKEELTEELIKYARAIGKYTTKLYFLYKGKPLTFEKRQYIFDYKKTYIIFVYDLEIKTEKNEEIENVLCPECGNLASIIINNDNKLSIQNCKNKHKISNLTIDTFLFLQLNYNNNKYVECNICNNKKSYYNNFYVCSCGETICPLCKVEHNNNNHNIIDYNKRFLICKKHYKPFLSYCQSCYLNICSTCEAENHNSHKIKNLKEIQKNEKTLNEMQKEINDFKIKNNDYINEITKLNFNDFINNKKNTLKEYNQLNNIFLYLLYKSKNYENINTILNSKLKKMNKDYNNEIEIFINKLKSLMIKDDNKKNEMTIIYKNNNIKGKSKQKIQLFGQKFVDKNKNKCSLLINDKKYELMEVYNLDKSEEKKFLIIKLIEIKPTIDFSYMFYNCESLISIADISYWNTNNIINLNYMFYNCRSLKSLPDISKWNTNKVIDISYMFFNCSSLQNLPDISKWNINNVKNKECIFSCVNEQVKLKNYELLKSFYNNEIKIIYKNNVSFKIFDGDFIRNNENNFCLMVNNTKIELCSYIFGEDVEVKEAISVILIEINKITNMSYMFSGCDSLLSISDISKLNTSNVINMNHMFSGCNSLLPTSNILKLDTSKVIDISYMFSGCNSLTSLPDISKWDTKNVSNMEGIFSYCKSLTSLPDISKWDTKNVSNIKDMFRDCESLTSLPDISNWNTSNVINMNNLFCNCKSLTSFPNLSNWNNKNLKFEDDIFYNIDENVKNKNSNYIKKFIHNELAMIYKIKPEDSEIKLIEGSYYIENRIKLLINGNIQEKFSKYYTLKENDKKKEFIFVKLIDKGIKDMSEMFAGCESLISFQNLFEYRCKPLNLNSMFAGCKSLISLPDMSKWDMSEVTDISYIFFNCNSLKSLPDISKWDLNKVINIEWMFGNCLSLESLPDISNWNTSNVTNMSCMFCNCSSLKYPPDISNWNTSNVTDMGLIFTNCSSLLSLPDISHLNFEKVENKEYIFSNINEHIKNKYTNLIPNQVYNEMTLIYKNESEYGYYIDLFYFDSDYAFYQNNKKNFILKFHNLFLPPYYCICKQEENNEIVIKLIEKKKISNISEMFHGCHNLVKLFIPEGSTFNFNNIEGMFTYCSSLVSISNIFKYTSNITNIDELFYGCKSLQTLPDLSILDTSEVISMNRLFAGCESLKSIPDISKWNISKCSSMESLFEGCKSLISLPDISKWDTCNIKSMSYIFQDCKSLLSFPDISKWTTYNVEDMRKIFEGCESAKLSPEICKKFNVT